MWTVVSQEDVEGRHALPGSARPNRAPALVTVGESAQLEWLSGKPSRGTGHVESSHGEGNNRAMDDDLALSQAVARDLRRRYGADYRVVRATAGHRVS